MITYPEGATPLDPDEIVGLKFKHISTQEELDHLEQANIQSGLRWLSHQKHQDYLTEVFIKRLHKKLFGEVWKWAGTFRTTEKNIGIDPRNIQVQLRMLIDDVKYWIEHNIYPPVEITLRFHHRLVYIHLFPNGNGRHARVMADTLLIYHFGLEEIDWSRGFDLQTMNQRRKSYIIALRQADKGDYNLLLEFANQK